LASPNTNQPLSALLPEELIQSSERRWFFAMAAVLGVMLAIIVITGMGEMLHPLSDVETIDPTTLHLSGEFVESNLGTAIEPDGSATVRFVAQQYMFVPQCVKVPADTPVRFRLTSADVTHGFFVGQTNTNAMVVPGFITDVRARFPRTGDYKMPCDEFCGYGHHAMSAHVIVVAKNEFKSVSPEERVSCGAQ
jgi:cytochrome c oxidase subunit II